ncbi:hypothetical protein [Nostocoides sp.]|uniref:hypothetical protein n=1 Tax=Nostocoides sp. TaxID=1917966 RepID=UPI002D1FAA5B|nr:hypothetical protein [Tetrasphaera sp.]
MIARLADQLDAWVTGKVAGGVERKRHRGRRRVDSRVRYDGQELMQAGPGNRASPSVSDRPLDSRSCALVMG